MSTYCSTYNGGNSFGKLISNLLIIILLIIGIVLGMHALKHSGAESVRNCGNDKIGLILFNPETGRKAILCEVEKDQWGRMIVEKEQNVEKEVTSFVDSQTHKNSLEYAVRNLVNRGYIKLNFVTDKLSWEVNQILDGLQVFP
jgi:hypothetical protein